jgi:N-acetylglucosamine-6-phosphate deacetylase
MTRRRTRGADDEVEERPHRAVVPGLSERESGFLSPTGWLEAGEVRIITLAPELPGAPAVIRHLADHGVVVSMGHSDATWEEAQAGADAGARLGTHLFNAMRPFSHRDPGIVGYLLASHLPVSVIGDGVHVSGGTVALVARVKGPDELVLITDALAGLGMPPGRYALSGIEFITDGICGRLPNGTLSGSLLPLNRAVRNLVSFGIEPTTAVRAATLNPARVLGVDERHGRVEVGRAADLVLVDQDWEILATLIEGRLAAGTVVRARPSPVSQERLRDCERPSPEGPMGSRTDPWGDH